MIKIDKNVPIPAPHHEKYPWSQMEIGDSFFVDKANFVFSGSVTFARKKYPDRKFKTQREGAGTRVWRIS